jgi:hypothetical protein
MPTDEFKRFVREKNNRSHIMEELLRKNYPDIFNRVALTTEITDALLWEAFSKYSSSENTIRKMISFFKQAAMYAGINISASTRSPRGGGKIHPLPPRKDAVISVPAARANIAAGNPSITTGTTRTIPLKNGGGTITLTVTMDPFVIDEEDQSLIFGIIKTMNAYHAKHNPEEEK